MQFLFHLPCMKFTLNWNRPSSLLQSPTNQRGIFSSLARNHRFHIKFEQNFLSFMKTETTKWRHRLPARGVNSPSQETFHERLPKTFVRCNTGMAESALGERHGLNDLSRSFQPRFSVILRDRIPGLMDLCPDLQWQFLDASEHRHCKHFPPSTAPADCWMALRAEKLFSKGQSHFQRHCMGQGCAASIRVQAVSQGRGGAEVTHSQQSLCEKNKYSLIPCSSVQAKPVRCP